MTNSILNYVQGLHEIFIKLMIIKLKHDLSCHLLKCSSNNESNEKDDTRELYKVYGLLLSACNFKEKPKNEIIVDPKEVCAITSRGTKLFLGY